MISGRGFSRSSRRFVFSTAHFQCSIYLFHPHTLRNQIREHPTCVSDNTEAKLDTCCCAQKIKYHRDPRMKFLALQTKHSTDSPNPKLLTRSNVKKKKKNPSRRTISTTPSAFPFTRARKRFIRESIYSLCIHPPDSAPRTQSAPILVFPPQHNVRVYFSGTQGVPRR